MENHSTSLYRIRRDAAQARAMALSSPCFVPAKNFDSLNEFLGEINRLLEKSLPRTIEHKGHVYRLEIDVQTARIAIFEAEAEKSLMVAMLTIATGDSNHPKN